jgi:hypothetical protein
MNSQLRTHSEDLEESQRGESHDQADAEWIVIRTQQRGHNDTPFGRILYVLVTIY